MGKIYFISGHRDLTKEEFNKYYVPKIQSAIKEGGSFVIGDYYGADIMAQNYIVEQGYADKITVYHMFTAPRNLAPGIKNIIGGFKDDIERDSEMTRISDEDIAFIRKGRWTSGTAQNILRRIEF